MGFISMEKEEFFRIYQQIKNNEYKDLENLDFSILHRINTMLLYEIELKKLQNAQENK